MIRLAILSFALLVTGCSIYSSSVPENYAGPRAQLNDSIRSQSRTKADFFVAEEIDGRRIDHSLDETFRKNRGRGFSLTSYQLGRPLVAGKSIKVLIMGRTYYAAPIQELTGRVFQVKGIVEFTPRVNTLYVVRGVLGENYSAVWIEDTETHQPVGQKIEVSGAARPEISEQ